ncbi:Ig domain protein group 2 domain protein [Paenibacillus pinisoli]|uniref:Ig domain protein group 2 domain protein n=1 Tax=Paenibacillus pinisoli TaxID=1276110 RepID=UPI001FB410E5|nr:Ig domain protein group 2 domain protein [Paenibacillus pinisoli]
MNGYKRIVSLLLSAALIVGLWPIGQAYAEGPSDPAPVLMPIGTSNGKSVLFDNSHGQTAGAADWVIDGAFSAFGSALAAEGYYVKEHRKSGPLTAGDLSGYDVFVIPEANIPFKTSEQQVLADYVEDGGSIFFIADHYNADRNKNRWDSSEVFNGYRRGAWANPKAGMGAEEAASAAMQGVASSDWLSDEFGMRIRYNALGNVNSGYIVAPSQAFGITAGVGTVTMHAGSTIAITDPGRAKGIVYTQTTSAAWPNAVDQGVYNGGGIAEGPYAAVAKKGLGKVAVIGDSSPVEDITPKYKREETGGTKTTYDGWYEMDNAILLTNIIDWLAAQESYTDLTQVSGLTLDSATALLPMENPQTSTEPQFEPWSPPAAGYKWWDPSTFKPGSYGYSAPDTPNPPDGDGSIETFEAGVKGAYATGTVTLDSGSWTFDNALIGDMTTDKKVGAKSARVRADGSIYMNADVTGVQSIKVQHANFGSDSGATWKLQKSLNGGATWKDAGGAYTSGSTLAEQTIVIGESGSVRFKITVSGISGKRLNFDQFEIVPMPSEVLLETFENGVKGAYAAGAITLDSGSWTFDNALIGDLVTDQKIGAKSARLRAAGSIAMNFDLTGGVKSVKVQHANFGSDSGATWKLQKSVNGGVTWTDAGGPYTSSALLTEQTVPVNESGSVRFKIAAGGTSGKRLNLDQIIIVK